MKETEEVLFNIWKEILERDDFTSEDDFYSLGGTSLQAFTLIMEIKKKFDLELPLMYVLTEASISSLAEVINSQLGSNES
ncbi:phosphopantetheine-binding protein [Clostridium sp. BNL1100]|uniref:acyl carrier protein n=1 Tax=Clostridium sp. BNL1100 TaxID=755731 RepID=UPI00024A7A0A|nr:phosphopantetheine-binding protein [Clostridium sp. BNL1100]AEY64870.1 phosphopantetheine-containing protein [Clostridium sp. BNL1100]